MYSFLSLTEFKQSRIVKKKKNIPAGFRVMHVGKHKTGVDKTAVIAMSPEEYDVTCSYVENYWVLMPKLNCDNDECPLFPGSLKTKKKPVSDCCSRFEIGNISKVIIFLSRIDTLVEIVKLYSSF